MHGKMPQEEYRVHPIISFEFPGMYLAWFWAAELQKRLLAAFKMGLLWIFRMLCCLTCHKKPHRTSQHNVCISCDFSGILWLSSGIQRYRNSHFLDVKVQFWMFSAHWRLWKTSEDIQTYHLNCPQLFCIFLAQIQAPKLQEQSFSAFKWVLLYVFRALYVLMGPRKIRRTFKHNIWIIYNLFGISQLSLRLQSCRNSNLLCFSRYDRLDKARSCAPHDHFFEKDQLLRKNGRAAHMTWILSVSAILCF